MVVVAVVEMERLSYWHLYGVDGCAPRNLQFLGKDGGWNDGRSMKCWSWTKLERSCWKAGYWSEQAALLFNCCFFWGSVGLYSLAFIFPSMVMFSSSLVWKQNFQFHFLSVHSWFNIFVSSEVGVSSSGIHLLCKLGLELSAAVSDFFWKWKSVFLYADEWKELEWENVVWMPVMGRKNSSQVLRKRFASEICSNCICHFFKVHPTCNWLLIILSMLAIITAIATQI